MRGVKAKRLRKYAKKTVSFAINNVGRDPIAGIDIQRKVYRLLKKLHQSKIDEMTYLKKYEKLFV